MAEISEVLPPQERYRHDVIERARPSRGARTSDLPPLRVISQTWLDRYYLQELIDELQYDAGNRLYAEWRRSGSEPRVVAAYQHRIEGRSDENPTQAHYRHEVTKALREVGPLCSLVLIHVCLVGGSAKDWQHQRGITVKSYGICVLREALTLLGDHYWPSRRRKRA